MALPKSLLDSHAQTIKLVQEVFELNNDAVKVVLETSDLPECKGGVEVGVPSMTWTLVLPFITKISVVTREIRRNPPSVPLVPFSGTTTSTPRQELNPVAPLPVESGYITLIMEYENKNKKASVKVKRNEKLKCLERVFMRDFEPKQQNCEHFRFCYDGALIKLDWTPQNLEMEDGDIVNIYPEQTGGKPIIYIFPPTGQEEMDVSVSLSLIQQWKFSAIYPVVSVQPNQLEKSIPGECVTWDVRMHRDQTMTEKSTGLTVSYLYWEAVTQGLPPSPLDSPRSEQQQSEEFDPISSDLSDNDNVSVVLPLSRITPYLDAALKELGLHTEARTSFITYWLPSFNKHTHIALRFISQDAYENAAPLSVVPKPDAVVRVFMLFKGVPESDFESGIWPKATARVVDRAERWRDVVGLDAQDSLTDESLFRVLEWGEMEMKK